MPATARLGDTISHGGVIISASPHSSVDGIPTARQGDAVICNIHGPQTIADGSPLHTVDGRRKARVGDPITCGAVISSGSGTVDTGP